MGGLPVCDDGHDVDNAVVVCRFVQLSLGRIKCSSGCWDIPLDNPPRNPNLDQSQAHLQWTMFVAEDMSPPYWSAPILGKGRITVLEVRELG